MCFGTAWTGISMSICAIVSVLCLAFGIDFRITAAPLFLFLKEWIQYQSYQDLRCNRRNQVLSTMSWIHISFQPLIVNLFFSYFAPNRAKEYRLVIWLCGIYAIFNMFRLRELRGSISEECQSNPTSICKPNTCSYMGVRHLAYGFQLQTADDIRSPSWFSYLLLSFAPVFILGPRSLGAVHLGVAFLAVLLGSGNWGETSAIWCLNSFWFSAVALYVLAKTNIRFKK